MEIEQLSSVQTVLLIMGAVGGAVILATMTMAIAMCFKLLNAMIDKYKNEKNKFG